MIKKKQEQSTIEIEVKNGEAKIEIDAEFERWSFDGSITYPETISTTLWFTLSFAEVEALYLEMTGKIPKE
jgi:hypothetical protein